jgi:hypothetical protein
MAPFVPEMATVPANRALSCLRGSLTKYPGPVVPAPKEGSESEGWIKSAGKVRFFGIFKEEGL